MSAFSELREQFVNLDEKSRLRIGIGIAIVLALAILWSTVNDQVARLKKKLIAREASIAELLILKQRYLEANAGSQKLANRLAAVRADDSPAKIIEDIGIKGKNSQIKPVKGEEQGAYVEDSAEVKLEGLTANEAVNLLYQLEKGSKPVLVKKALLKSRFDDPARLDLTLTVALLKAAPQGQR